jgi:serine/threonine protein kinase
LQILGEAARGIAAGHRAGLIHRDVKPANLFLENGDDRSGPRVRVLDFGIAQVLEIGEETLTHLTVFGSAPLSPGFASPEQLRGVRGLTPASDVYSLGATGIFILTGSKPRSPRRSGGCCGAQPWPIPASGTPMLASSPRQWRLPLVRPVALAWLMEANRCRVSLRWPRGKGIPQ